MVSHTRDFCLALSLISRESRAVTRPCSFVRCCVFSLTTPTSCRLARSTRDWSGIIGAFIIGVGYSAGCSETHLQVG